MNIATLSQLHGLPTFAVDDIRREPMPKPVVWLTTHPFNQTGSFFGNKVVLLNLTIWSVAGFVLYKAIKK